MNKKRKYSFARVMKSAWRTVKLIGCPLSLAMEKAWYEEKLYIYGGIKRYTG